MAAISTFQLSLPVDQGRLGKPRLDPYSRLLSRFYEPFILLIILGATRRIHETYPGGGSLEQQVRREFMRDLAFICDGKKGGTTFTSFSIEETDDEYIFHVASKSLRKAKLMLERSLLMLRQYAMAPVKQRSEMKTHFLEMCINHARIRIEGYIYNLNMAVDACVRELNSSASIDEGFIHWLLSLPRRDDSRGSHRNACIAVCEALNSEQMRTLSREQEREMRSYDRQGLPGYANGPFTKVQHSMGRLAARISKPCFLLLNARSMDHILSRAKVESIKPCPCVPKPQADAHTTLPGILRRMFRADDPSMSDMKQKLEEMQQDSAVRILNLFMEKLRQCNPRVHSEVSVLEFFFTENRRFIDNDRYVYSSKPACFACKLYFDHHPARMVTPESHGKAYLNWSPPLVQGFHKDDARSRQQRDLMIKITQTVRDELISQLLSGNQPPGWHPDSTTGALTASLFYHDDVGNEFGTNNDDTSAIALNSVSGTDSTQTQLPPVIGRHSEETEALHLHDRDDSDDEGTDDEGGASLH